VIVPNGKEGIRMRVLVVNHISLDGVLQGPGRPDEDTRRSNRVTPRSVADKALAAGRYE
jgi:hypothetical protein